MGHFSVVFVKIKIFYGLFNFCMGHLHIITKLYVSNGPWLLPFPIPVKSPVTCKYMTLTTLGTVTSIKRPETRKYMTGHFPWYRHFNQKACNT
jgi:hypothetical protein